MDRPATCGDTVCGEGESCGTCPVDCGQCCGDGVCRPEHGEHCGTCLADCGCADDERCDVGDRVCVEACVPDCGGRECGPDGCNGSCGGCDGDAVCNGAGECQDLPAACGDAECGVDEDCSTCPADCGQCCGDGTCEAARGEHCGTCLADCGCDDGQRCDVGARACIAGCVPDCEGAVCGPDGCNGFCPPGCEGAQVCDSGACEDPPAGCGDGECNGEEHCGTCPADCGNCCGDGECEAGRGETCGSCPLDCGCAVDQRCDLAEQTCVEVCQPACDGRECGADGCDGVCGVCQAGEMCEPEAGLCEPVCTPDCDGRECGDDGCGGVCGPCDGVCTQNGRCPGEGEGCICDEGELCLDGVCRLPEQFCAEGNPDGVCPNGLNCLAGECIDQGGVCSLANPAGACPLGELCRDGVCEALDDAALCDDHNACTADVFDPVRNRCVHPPVDVDCDDGNACTMNHCEEGVCVAAPIGGCIEPPRLDPYRTPTNEGALDLSGSKPVGAAIEINGEVAVPGGENEGIPLNLVQRSNGGAWEARRPMPTTRYGLTAVHLGGRVYAMGGKTNGGAVLGTVEVYDVGANTWGADVPAMPRQRYAHATIARGTDIYVVGGEDENGIPIEEVDIFSTANNQWRQGPDLPTPRSFPSVGFMENIGNVNGNHDGIVVAGGRLAGGVATAVVEELTVGDQVWRPRSSLPAPRYGAGSVTLAGAGDVDSQRIRVWVVGGQAAPDGAAGGLTTAMTAYTHDLDYVGHVAAMPAGRFLHAAQSLNEHVYLFGGRDFQETQLVWRFDPETGRYSEAAELPSLQNALVSAVVGGRLYAIGGANGFGLAVPTTRSYDPAEKRWREHQPMPVARSEGAVAVLSDEIWVIGGNNNGVLQSVEIYNPEDDEWRAGPLLPVGRKGAMAVTYQDTIWLFGGVDENDNLVSQVLRLDGDVWQNRGGGVALAYGFAAVTGVDRITLFGGRAGGRATGDIHRYRPSNTSMLQLWTEDTMLLLDRDRVAGTLHNGHLYLFGGNSTPEVGPNGEPEVQRIGLRCFDGVRQEGEGAVTGQADDGFGSGASAAARGCTTPRRRRSRNAARTASPASRCRTR